MSRAALLRTASGLRLPLDFYLKLQSLVLTAPIKAPISLDDSILALLELLASWLRVESLSLMLYDAPTSRLRLAGITGLSRHHSHEEFQRPGEKLTGLAFATNEIVFSNNLREDKQADHEMTSYWSDQLSSGHLRSAVFIPLSATPELRGVFRAFNRLNSEDHPDEKGFTKADRTLLTDFAELLASHIELLTERGQYHYLTDLFETLPTFSSVEKLAFHVAKGASLLANCSAANVYLLDAADPDNLRLVGSWGLKRHYRELRRFPLAGSIAGTVAIKGESRIVSDLSKEPGVANRHIAEREGLISCVAVPVRSGDTLGCLAVFCSDKKQFRDPTISALESLGSFLASLLEAQAEAIKTEHFRTLLPMLGHSLRSPLSGIRNYARRARNACRNISGADVIESQLDKIFLEIKRAERRFEGLLFAKKEVLRIMGVNKKPVHLGQLLEECVERHRLPAESRPVRLVLYDSARKLPTIQADIDKLEIVFDNLLENAIKYSWANEPIEIRGWHSPKLVRVEVSDKGLGIPEKYYRTIFDAFQRSSVLDSTRYIQGTGLGLELVRTVVEAHDGTVSVESEPFLKDPVRLEKYEGFTTTFTVTLPR